MPKPKKKPPHRPCLYNRAQVQKVIKRVANGETLKAICRDMGTLSPSTFRLWVIDDRGGLAARYARAREAQAEAWSDEIIELADDTANDMTENKNGETVCNHEWINRSRLRVDARKWLMAKLHPRAYGEKVETKLVTEEGGSVSILTILRGANEAKP